eukprot:4670915-Lingulodinium_polyedra.AAC.1
MLNPGRASALLQHCKAARVCCSPPRQVPRAVLHGREYSRRAFMLAFLVAPSNKLFVVARRRLPPRRAPQRAL